MKNVMEMRQKRAALVTQARELDTKAESEKRDLTAEERTQWDKIMADVDKAKVDIEHEERLQASEMANPSSRQAAGAIENSGLLPGNDHKAEKRAAFFKWMRQGKAGLAAEERALVENTAGLYMVPEDLEAEIYRALPKLCFMRQLATVRTTSMDKVSRRSLTEVSGGWGKLETGTVITESTPTPTKDYIYVEDWAGLTKIGKDELQDTDANLEAVIADSFARAAAEAQDTGFTVGTGHANLQPDGIALDATSGITKIDLATADVIIIEDILGAIYAVAPQYRKNGSFLMNSKTELALRKLRATYTGGSGEFLWQPSVQEGKPDLLAGYPVYNQDDMNYPADSVADKNCVIFGDFKAGYRVVDRVGIAIQRLDELYAEAGLVGFIGHFRVGGGVVRAAAFSSLQNPT
jgi:HK97 family phage major capsid protein